MTFTIILGISLAGMQLISGSGPKKDGRIGNDHLEKEQYEQAVTAYQQGLSSYETPEEVDQTYHGLQHNLGLTLHRQQNFEQARDAFAAAMASALNDDAMTKAAYNAGNHAFSGQQLEQALEHYRTALLADPDNEDAKFNYEFVRRQLQDEQNQDEPSESDETQDEQSERDQSQGEEPNDQQQNQDSEQESNPEGDPSEQDKPEPGKEQEEQSGEQTPPPQTPLTREQAERILEALENEEEQLLRELQKVQGRPRRVAKDW